MGAGGSAESESERARRVAQRHRRKSERAEWVADNYARGAEGERMVEQALAPLEADGWRLLHDRLDPAGGNIDHIAIGPPGVAVIDAKNWSSPTTITADRRLVASKHDHTATLDHLRDAAERVRLLTALDGMQVAVRGYLVLTGEADRAKESKDLGDVRVLGVESLAARLRKARGDLSADLVDAIWQTLADALPDATAPAPPAGAGAADAAARAMAEPSALFDRIHRFYYLRPWKRSGHHRLYLRDSTGHTLGWTDVNTGSMSIDCSGEDKKLAEALLAAADPSGIKLDPDDLPKVATRLWGGRLLSRIARMHTSVLVGQEWRNFGKHRLYGTLVDPAVDTYSLGYVDLKTREIHPSVDGDLGKDRGSPDRYLGYLLTRMPPEPAKK